MKKSFCGFENRWESIIPKQVIISTGVYNFADSLKIKAMLMLFIRQGVQTDLNWLCWRRAEQIWWISASYNNTTKYPSISQRRWSLFSKTIGAEGFGIIQFIQSWLAISTLHMYPILPLILRWFCDSKPNFGYYDFFPQLTEDEMMWGLSCSLPWECFIVQ